MVNDTLRQRADRHFEQALSETGARDPRDFYRNLLRDLRERDEQAFQRALHYFETELVPRVAEHPAVALAEWLEYGRVLAESTSAGRTVQVDATGRARDYNRPVPPESLILHLPQSARDPVLVVGIPPELSSAQRATYELLVAGKQG